MEFLHVRFVEQRKVIIDDVNSNQETNAVIEVEGGTHTIKLDAPPDSPPDTPPDYAPESVQILLEGTGPLTPMEVKFEKK